MIIVNVLHCTHASIHIYIYIYMQRTNRVIHWRRRFSQSYIKWNDRDDQILLASILFCIGHMVFPGRTQLPLWRTDGITITLLLHAGPVEFLDYWFHRALHHHFLYSRYHSLHHSSIVTEPISGICLSIYTHYHYNYN